MNQSAFNPIPAQHVQSVAHLHRVPAVPHIQPLRPNFIPPSPQNISPSLGSHRQIPPRRIQPKIPLQQRIPVVKRESVEQRNQRVLQQRSVVQRPYHPPVAQPGYVNHDHYDHFYQDMTFTAHIIRWTTAQTGEIRIDGVAISTNW